MARSATRHSSSTPPRLACPASRNSALDIGRLPSHAIVADLVYVPLVTPLLRAARARGLRTADGLGMLMHQAVRGFMLWFGKKPEVTAELRALLEADLGPSAKPIGIRPADPGLSTRCRAIRGAVGRITMTPLKMTGRRRLCFALRLRLPRRSSRRHRARSRQYRKRRRPDAHRQSTRRRRHENQTCRQRAGDRHGQSVARRHQAGLFHRRHRACRSRTAARRPSGSHIFTEAQRGVGEGHQSVGPASPTAP